MDTDGQMDQTKNAQVLGAAGVASGLVGGVVAAVMARRARQKEAEAEAAAQTPDVAALLGAVREGAASTLDKVRERSPQSGQDWKDATSRMRDQAATVAREGQARTARGLGSVDLQELGQRARNALPSQDLQKRTKRARKRVRAAADEGRKRSRKRIESVDTSAALKRGQESLAGASAGLAAGAATVAAAATERARSAAGSVGDRSPQAADRARELASHARGVGEDLVTQARRRAPELKDVVEERVGPSVRQLQEGVSPVLEATGSRLASTLETGKELLSDARDTAERDLLPALRERGETAVKGTSETARNADKVLGSVSSQASQTYSQVAGNVGERSREAAHATAQGTKDTGAIAAWSVIGGGLIYLAFLDKEQRAKVKEVGSRFLGGTRGMYQDVRGQDGSFDERE